MAVLVCPDVHERLDRLAIIEERYFPKADSIIMLGDFFDAFGPEDLDRVRQMCQWLNKHANGYRYEDGDLGSKLIPIQFLLGNHCVHYLFPHDGYKCSGYSVRKQGVIDKYLSYETKQAFRIFTKVGAYTLSHAGFHEATLGYAKREVEKDALETAFAGGYDAIFGAGRARGGSHPVGGPTWLDWNFEFEHIDDFPQIVGHTNGKDVRVKGPNTTHTQFNQDGTVEVHEPGTKSYCIDTALHNIAWLDNDVVTFERCC